MVFVVIAIAMGRQLIGKWRPVAQTIDTSSLQHSRPTAPIGVTCPPKSDARSIDLSNILPSYSLNSKIAEQPLEPQHTHVQESEMNTLKEDTRKLIANIPEMVLANLRSTCAAKAEVSLLGRIHGKHPGLKALTAWARDTLHPSFSLLILKTNNLFEVTFAHPEGRIHALTQAELVCDTAAIFFSSWRPHFSSKTSQTEDSLDHPVWVQIVDLCQVLREESFLKIIGEQIGQVISIDNAEGYRAKLFGPRIRLLVQNLDRLPQTVVIPRLDGDGTVEYKLEFSGLPHQCGRCRAHDHQVRNCPKKFPPISKKDGFFKETRREPIKKVVLVETTTEEEAATSLEQPSRPGVSLEEITNTTEDLTITQDTHPVQEEINQVPVSLCCEDEVNQLPTAPCTETQGVGGGENSRTDQDFSISKLQPNDINFPKLQSHSVSPVTPQSQKSELNSHSKEPLFVWSKQGPALATKTQKSKVHRGKAKLLDSVPLTRQGYRTGRLAEDFWSALGMPNTPVANPKMLRVIPFLTKNRHMEQPEYLVDKRGQSFSAIAHVHIAELLAGIPWTQSRARQHVVDEVSQTLHKSLIFNSNLSNPFQLWTQGQWYAQWGQGAEGEHICTLYASIDVLEQKVNPRKGNNMGWRREPVEISSTLVSHTTEEIHFVESHHTLWQRMAGRLPSLKDIDSPPPESHNRFATLLDEEASSDQ